MKFDKIFLFHVLEHIYNPIEYLKELKEKLNQYGKIFIEIPNNNDILLKGYQIQEFRDFYYQSAHLWYFNRSSLEFIFEQLNLKYNIYNIQRYDLSNHIKWLKDKKPGGQGFYDNLFSNEIKNNYKKFLIENDKSDTLFCILYEK